jgi:hypothetical protein
MATAAALATLEPTSAARVLSGKRGGGNATHAVVLTGVDLDDAGHAMKWRVENSWGTDLGDEGYMLMADAWFDEFVYELTVDKAYLSSDLLEVLETEPIVLPPWDPMGRWPALPDVHGRPNNSGNTAHGFQRAAGRTFAAQAHSTVFTWKAVSSGCLERISATIPAI